MLKSRRIAMVHRSRVLGVWVGMTLLVAPAVVRGQTTGIAGAVAAATAAVLPGVTVEAAGEGH